MCIVSSTLYVLSLLLIDKVFFRIIPFSFLFCLEVISTFSNNLCDHNTYIDVLLTYKGLLLIFTFFPDNVGSIETF